LSLPGHSPPNDLEYERWFQAYLTTPEPKSPAKVAASAKARKARIAHAIHVGWPDYPALKDRAKNHAIWKAAEKAVAQVVDMVVSPEVVANAATMVLERWDTAVKGHMRTSAEIGEAIKAVGAQVRIASREATFVQYRRIPELDDKGAQVYDGQGKPLMKVERYIPMETVARATARLAMAAKDHAVLHKALLDSLSPVKDAAIDMSDAPQEVLDYVQRKWGAG
jgi:hypothetical protein